MNAAFIWMTMCGAIAAHDGGPYVNWQTYGQKDGLPSDKVLAVCVQGDTVWAGTDKGLARFDGRDWETLSTEDGLCHPAVTSLAVDSETGNLWIGTMGGACRFSAGRMDAFTQLNSGLANNLVYDVKVIRGKVWLATTAGTSRYDPAADRWSIFTETNTPMHEIWCYALSADSSKVYVGVWGGGVLEYDEWRDRWRDHTDPDREMEIDLFRDDGLNHDVVSSVTIDSQGLLWVGTYFGLSSYDGRRWKNYYDHDSPLASNFVNAVQSQGSVTWICTDRGLNAVDEQVWWTYRRHPQNAQAGIAVRRDADGRQHVYQSRGLLPHDYVLGVDFQGDDLWVATARGIARARRDENAVPVQIQVAIEQPADGSGVTGSAAPVYGNAPVGAIPYRQFADPYLSFFQRPQLFTGPGRDKQTSRLPRTIRIGVMAPLDGAPDSDLGEAMLRGIRQAMDETNAAGGYRGRPYELVLRKDLGQWGASSNEMVRFAHDDHVWAVIGSISGDNTHIALRAALKLDMPMINTATTDPTLTETGIPWILRCMADDRQQGYALALEIIEQRKLKRIAVLRENGRYGRLGIAEFRDAARRMKVPLLAELNFFPGETDFQQQLTRIETVRPEALVLWAGTADAARIVQAVRARKMDVTIFGTDRMVSDAFLTAAGEDAEGIVAVSTMDPSSDASTWTAFRDAYRRKFQQLPESFAAHGYDGTKILLAAIDRAGLNHIKIMDALRDTKDYSGVTGPIAFDSTLADVGPVWLATIANGQFAFQPSALRPVAAAANTSAQNKKLGGVRLTSNATVTPQQQANQLPRAAANRPVLAAHNNASPDAYVRVGDRPVGYYGPRPDTTTTEQQHVIGVFLPASGIDAGLTKSVRRGTELAFQAAPRHFRLVVYQQAEPWGKASAALVDMVFDERALAIIGGIDRRSTHLAEQVAVKAGLPVLTPTCTEPSVTSVPIPWIFRCARRQDGDALAGAGSTYAIDTEQMAEFRRLFQATFGEAPDLSAALAYDTAQLLIEAVAGGATTRVALRDALASRPAYSGITGPIRFNNVGDR